MPLRTGTPQRRGVPVLKEESGRKLCKESLRPGWPGRRRVGAETACLGIQIAGLRYRAEAGARYSILPPW